MLITPPGKPVRAVVVPDSLGQPLEWNEPPPSHAVFGFLTYLALCIGGLTVAFRGLDWLFVWYACVFAVGLPIWMYFLFWKDRILAGAVWVQSQDKWAATYELTKIRFTTQGYNRAIRIEDVRGNRLTLRLREVQAHPLLWDLVHNGMVHSVASGNCDISRTAARHLKIPRTIS